MNLQLLQMLGAVAILESLLIVGLLYLLYRTKIREWILQRPEWWFWGRLALDVGLPRWNYEKAVLWFRRLAHFPLESWEELTPLLRGKIQENLQQHQEKIQILERSLEQLRRKYETHEETKALGKQLIVLQHELDQFHQEHWRYLAEHSALDLSIPEQAKCERWLKVQLELSWLESRPIEALWRELQQFVEIYNFKLITGSVVNETAWRKHCFWKTQQSLSANEYKELLKNMENTLKNNTMSSEEQPIILKTAISVTSQLQYLFHPANLQIGPLMISSKNEVVSIFLKSL